MEANDKNSIAQRTEEVRDIIDRMPHRTGRIVSVIVVSLAAFLVLFGLTIDYPEKVTGTISITARQAPVRLVANTSGRIHLLRMDGDMIRENETMAYLDNPARLADVLKIEKFIRENRADSIIDRPENRSLANDLILGELSISYYSLLNSLQKLGQYKSGRPFEKRLEGARKLLESQLRLLIYNLDQRNTNIASLNIIAKNVRRDSFLFRSATIAEADLERSAVGYLGKVEVNQQIAKEITNIQLQIDDTKSKLQLLELEQQETEQKLKMDFYSSYNELANNILKWKITYTLQSPFAGKLEYLNFWHENDFIAAGTPLLSVIPSDNPLFGQMYLPSQGVGKVSVGQDVIIRLDNYPYIEYGSVNGKVKMISGLANQTEAFAKKNDLNTYLITVELPDKLTTNYGTTLAFNYEIKGVADILTKKRKLLYRLFDNLKYIASKKTI